MYEMHHKCQIDQPCEEKMVSSHIGWHTQRQYVCIVECTLNSSTFTRWCAIGAGELLRDIQKLCIKTMEMAIVVAMERNNIINNNQHTAE